MTKLTYILAASHSGSTLLAMLLGSHPQIVTVGELKLSKGPIGDISRYRCSCRELIHQCPFWHRVKEGMAAKGFAFDIANAGTDYRAVKSRYARFLLGPLHRGKFLENFRDGALGLSPTWRKQLLEFHKRNAALAKTVCQLTGKDMIVDSSKIGLRLKYLLRNPELDVYVIRFIRDGRAVTLTYMDPAQFADAKTPALRGGGSGGDRAGERLSVSEAAHEWRRSNEEAEALITSLDRSRLIEIRYEELCTDSSAILSRIFAFLGFDSASASCDFRSMSHHVLGNGMRFDCTSEIRLDERWRNKLTEQDLRVFDKVAGETNRRYGYE